MFFVVCLCTAWPDAST